MNARLYVKFGEQVRALRKKAKLSQEELAELSDLHRTYVGGIERGERNPSLKNIALIAQALRVRPADLLGTIDLSDLADLANLDDSE